MHLYTCASIVSSRSFRTRLMQLILGLVPPVSPPDLPIPKGKINLGAKGLNTHKNKLVYRPTTSNQINKSFLVKFSK